MKRFCNFDDTYLLTAIKMCILHLFASNGPGLDSTLHPIRPYLWEDPNCPSWTLPPQPGSDVQDRTCGSNTRR